MRKSRVKHHMGRAFGDFHQMLKEKCQRGKVRGRQTDGQIDRWADKQQLNRTITEREEERKMERD